MRCQQYSNGAATSRVLERALESDPPGPGSSNGHATPLQAGGTGSSPVGSTIVSLVGAGPWGGCIGVGGWNATSFPPTHYIGIQR
jgi:hypothetical protein